MDYVGVGKYAYKSLAQRYIEKGFPPPQPPAEPPVEPEEDSGTRESPRPERNAPPEPEREETAPPEPETEETAPPEETSKSPRRLSLAQQSARSLRTLPLSKAVSDCTIPEELRWDWIQEARRIREVQKTSGGRTATAYRGLDHWAASEVARMAAPSGSPPQLVKKTTGRWSHFLFSIFT